MLRIVIILQLAILVISEDFVHSNASNNESESEHNLDDFIRYLKQF